MSYKRVIPRDLFNESKLLKCLGQLQLLIHDGLAPEGLELIHDTDEHEGFDICQDETTGSLFVSNLNVTICGSVLIHECVYNSKLPYPLWVSSDDWEAPVFNDDGSFTDDFLELCSKEATA